MKMFLYHASSMLNLWPKRVKSDARQHKIANSEEQKMEKARLGLIARLGGEFDSYMKIH